ncbi:MAG: hypothetical protein IPN02_16435 [Candidatus Microthrix sp.]|uniref:Uncharacterized protein n=1 Tax=Candidatus Neomicrothrix subdominans TaxID=2954438 RepID=A0A936NG68_9ACTN|nr:hypothetical protein [Candidatus Microthrix subdominans]
MGFEFTNDGKKVSDGYVPNGDGDVMGEVESVITGKSCTHCGPGRRRLPGEVQAGHDRRRITSDFTVTGEGGTACRTRPTINV